MKNFFLLLLATFFSFAATSCNRAEFRTSGNDAMSDDEISFRVEGLDVDVDTRAVSQVTDLTSFYVSASTGTMGSSDTYKWSSIQFNKSNGEFTGGKYWPDTNPNYHFYASNVSMTCTANSAPTIAVTSIDKDIVCAVCATPTHKATNALSFEHIFARLGSVTVNGPGEGYSLLTVSIMITPKNKGTYNIYSGNGKTDASGWTDTATTLSATEIAASDGQTKSNDIYLLPGSYTLTAKYTLTKGDYRREFTKTKDVSLEKGKINIITASIPKPGSGDGAQDIIFTITVAQWTDKATTVSF